MRAHPFARRLVRWFRAHRRKLPWREDRSPYRVLVSEVMLQQTTVAAVVPYFERFVRRFPDWSSLAGASDGELLGLWAGLGYYRRARSLRAAARTILSEHGGRFPHDLEAALALPGVGPYTAGAVLALSLERACPAVDGNVARVLSRHVGRSLDPGKPRERRELEALVLERLPGGAVREFTEALMELGALTCTARAPACGACPVASDCVGLREGRVGELPAPRRRPRPVAVRAAALLAVVDGRVLLRRRPSTAALMPGLWELPGGDTAGTAPRRWLESTLLPELGGGRAGRELGRIRHAITNRRLTLHVHEGFLDDPPRGRRGWRWASRAQASHLPLTAATAKALVLAGGP